MLQARSALDQSDKSREPDEYWVHVHESLVARVEIRFVRAGEKTLGFGVREVEEPDDVE